LRNFTFQCDDSADAFRDLFMSQNGLKSVFVSSSGLVQSDSNASAFQNTFTVGYQASVGSENNTAINWYQPYVADSAEGLKVVTATFQEGGYVNSHFLNTPKLPEVKSIWLSTTHSFHFTLLSGSNTSTSMANNVSAAVMLSQLNVITGGAARRCAKQSHGAWVEYVVTYDNEQSRHQDNLLLDVIVAAPYNSAHVAAVTTLTTADNYPNFLALEAEGRDGTITCYKREQNYTAFTLFLEGDPLGSISHVLAAPYSICFGGLNEANTLGATMAQLINKFGTK